MLALMLRDSTLQGLAASQTPLLPRKQAAAEHPRGATQFIHFWPFSCRRGEHRVRTAAETDTQDSRAGGGVHFGNVQLRQTGVMHILRHWLNRLNLNRKCTQGYDENFNVWGKNATQIFLMCCPHI